MAAEYFFPAETNQPIQNKILSAEFTILFLFVTPVLVILPNYIASVVVQKLGGSVWSVNLNTASWLLRCSVLPFVPIFIYDFFYYWFHRLQHTIPFMWDEHKLHHTEESLNVLTNLRHHWLEEVLRVPFITIPISLLAHLTPVQGAFIGVFISHWGLFIHSNLRLCLGPLTKILGGPQNHRIHHSREHEHIDKNFAAFFPIWDIAFGSYFSPASNEFPKTGLSSGERVTSFWRGVLLPFIGWFKIRI